MNELLKAGSQQKESLCERKKYYYSKINVKELNF